MKAERASEMSNSKCLKNYRRWTKPKKGVCESGSGLVHLAQDRGKCATVGNRLVEVCVP